MRRRRGAWVAVERDLCPCPCDLSLSLFLLHFLSLSCRCCCAGADASLLCVCVCVHCRSRISPQPISPQPLSTLCNHACSKTHTSVHSPCRDRPDARGRAQADVSRGRADDAPVAGARVISTARHPNPGGGAWHAAWHEFFGEKDQF